MLRCGVEVRLRLLMISGDVPHDGSTREKDRQQGYLVSVCDKLFTYIVAYLRFLQFRFYTQILNSRSPHFK